MTWYAALPLPCQIYGTHIQKGANASPYHAALHGQRLAGWMINSLVPVSNKLLAPKSINSEVAFKRKTN